MVAVGGDCHPRRLELAYRKGIFPWPIRGYPLLWFSPDPRFVLELDRVHLGRSTRKSMRRTHLEVRADTDFAQVLRRCADVRRPGQRGTWITEQMAKGYRSLHEDGLAHSVEAWREGKLVGGLYGVSLGTAFFGESMFALEDDASKIAFATLLGQLAKWGFDFVDCQVHTRHLERFGAVEWSRGEFLDRLAGALLNENKRGPWELDVTPKEVAERLSGRGVRDVLP